MKEKKKLLTGVLLGLIMAVAVGLRFYKLGEVPTGLSQDETSLGYNAYSILKTGKDERGVPYPMNFQAFGEYKLAGYIYLSVPSIAAFGPTAMGVRLPSAICGALTVLVTFLLVRELGKIGRNKTKSQDRIESQTFSALCSLISERSQSQKTSTTNNSIRISERSRSKKTLVANNSIRKNHSTLDESASTIFPNSLPLVAALLMAINPWHVTFSRAAFEVVPALLFVMIGVWMWAKWKNSGKMRWLAISAVMIVLSMYTYNICKLFSPLLWLWLMTMNWKEMWTQLKTEKKMRWRLLLAAVPAFILVAPLIKDALWGNSYSSTTGTLLNSSAVIEAEMLETRMMIVEENVWWSKVLFNDLVRTIYIWGEHIADYMSGSFFFATGSEHGNHGIGEMGMFYLWELVSIGAGIIAMIKNKPAWGKIMTGWIGLNIVIAAFTREAPHGTRGFFLILPLIMLSAYGLKAMWGWLKKIDVALISVWRVLGAGVGIVVIMYCFGYYLASYYWRMPVVYAESWHDQDMALMEFIRKNYDEYEEIIIDENALSNFLYASMAYSLPIEPEVWQAEAEYREADDEGFSKLSKVGKIAMAKVNFNEVVEISGKKLVITKADRKPDNIEQKWAVYYPEFTEVGTEAGKIYKWPGQKRAAYIGVVI